MQLDKANIKKILFIIIVAILVFLGVQNFDKAVNVLSKSVILFKPFIIGVGIAFALNVLMKVIEEKIFYPINRLNNKTWEKSRRGVSILLTFVVVIAALYILFFLIVPELRKSFDILVSNIHIYSDFFEKWTNKIIDSLGVSANLTENLKVDWDKFFSITGNFIKNFSNNFINTTVDITSAIVSAVFNLIIGIAFSIYLLAQKETLCAQAKKICLAYLSRGKAEYLIAVGKLSNRIFSRFVLGQLMEAIIIGFLCFLGMTVLRMPYASLIGTIVGVTALIPVFGAFFGTALGVFLILMIDPMKAFWFIVFIIVLQQVEGNIIYPRVVGSSIGLPGIWVLVAVTIGGSTFGITGMILGIPLSSVAYSLFRSDVIKRLRRREITLDDIENAGS